MSVSPNEASAASPRLRSNDGELVSVHVSIDPRLLEQLLETLANLSFPINPQIYHQAGVGYVHADGREDLEPATRVEFPAFSNHLDQVRAALESAGLPTSGFQIRGMVEDLQSDYDTVAAPDGAEYVKIRYYRRLPRV